jgi:hypothetical protein
MKRRTIVGLAFLIVGQGSSAWAAGPDAPADADTASSGPAAWDTAPATRRGGFTAGVLTGLSFGSVVGYPNDFAKIDQPPFRSATSGVGSTFTLYLGGALTDWFTFGFGLGKSSYGSSELVTESTAYLFHVEAFPLFARGGQWRDLALYADVGTGTATVRRRSDQAEFSSAGSLSIGGLGAFWEPWRLAGHLAFGPYGGWHYEESNSMARHFGEFGLRGAFYGGP